MLRFAKIKFPNINIVELTNWQVKWTGIGELSKNIFFNDLRLFIKGDGIKRKLLKHSFILEYNAIGTQTVEFAW